MAINDYVDDYLITIVALGQDNLAAVRQTLRQQKRPTRRDPEELQRAPVDRGEEQAAARAQPPRRRSRGGRSLSASQVSSLAPSSSCCSASTSRARRRTQLREAATAASRVAEGNLSVQALQAVGPGEVGGLTAAFNHMAEELESATSANCRSQNEKLRESERRRVGARPHRLPRAPDAAGEHPRLHVPSSSTDDNESAETAPVYGSHRP